MRFYHTLSFKIITTVFVAMFIVMLGVSYQHIEAQSAFLERTVYLCAERVSTFSKSALLHGMQENDRENIWETITNMSDAPGIDVIRIYDKGGVIRYSTQRDESGKAVDMQADACTMCHGEATEFEQTSSDEFMRIYDSPRGHRVLGLIAPIQNRPGCSSAPCHAHPPEQTVLGVLDVQMSLEETDAHVASMQNVALLASLITFLILTAASAVLIYFFVHKPVKALIAGTGALAAGDLEHTIELDRRDELGQLVKAFNSMSEELRRAKSTLVEWSNTLEDKVAEKTQQLNQVQAQILHMEKMASLGKLSSIIAHELNNPLAGILTYARLIEKRIGKGETSPEQCAKMEKEINLIADEARRCGDIVKNLLFFARGREGEYRQADLNEVIDKSIKLVQHKINLYEINLQVQLPQDVLLATCDQNQVQQATLAIIINAIEAMPDGGRLRITLSREGGNAVIRIADSGIGIARENQQRIFEPFFTTKEEGHGTGLGLSVAYGIIQSHGGSIRVESSPGKGTEFAITLPIHGPEQKKQEQV
ncbi:MAG: ATP-binding protein [Bacteroidota bacterium]|nr:ATP-binding protein [Bacteroidota bacterium]